MDSVIGGRNIALDPESLCRSWVKAAPHDPDAWLSLAGILRQADRMEEAEEAEREAARRSGTAAASSTPAPIVTRLPLAGVAYLLAKLLSLPKDRAAALLDRISLSNLDTAAAVRPLPETEAPIRAAVEEAATLIEARRYGEAVGLLRGVVTHFTSLLDDGKVDAALDVLNRFQEAVRDGTGWNLKHVLETIAGLVVGFDRRTLPVFADLARLNLYLDTDGEFTELASWFVQQARPPVPLTETRGVLRVERPEAMAAAAEALKADGYHIFGQVIPEDVRNRLVGFASAAPCMAIHPGQRAYEPTTVDLTRTDVDGFQIFSQAVLDQPDIQRLLIDPSFWAVAQEYLGCWPTAVGATMRWSIPSERADSDALAQMYHWDAGWLRWVNYFGYLTDVDKESGPHMYVRGTHLPHGKPAELRARSYARIPDGDIARFYPPEDIVTITGKSGTIFAGDTRCWHKGLHPTRHKRLTIQLSFANTVLMSSMFFGEKLTIKRSHLPEFRNFVRERPESFSSLYYDFEE